MHFSSASDESWDLRRRLRYFLRLYRRNSLLKVVLVAITFFVLFYECFFPGDRARVSTKQKPKVDVDVEIEAAGCPQQPIVNDILVVLRTGATEVLGKLPVHFETTLRCVPNHVVYSDYEEIVQGRQIHDVLDQVSATLKASAPEFRLYERLKAHGREGINTTEHVESGSTGSAENPSWKLDRFKFLPMVDKALRHRPNAKWFVFIEADTYIMWSNLVEYLTKLDASRDLYVGKHMYIGPVLFAHGGSGFVLSAPAMRKVTEHWRANMAEYEKYTAESWAGDMVLGKALGDVGVRLFWAWPHFQGEPVWALDHNVSKVDRRPWCYAPVTYHHMRAVDVSELWLFEQDWRRKGKGPLLHRDVFREFIVPKLSTKIDGWDNLSIDSEPVDVASLDECHAVCEAQADCLQYSYATGRCSTATEIRYGNEAQEPCVEYSVAASKCVRWGGAREPGGTVQSGWMINRLPRYMAEMDILCHGAEQDSWVI